MLSDSTRDEVIFAERARPSWLLRPIAHSRLYLRRRTQYVERKAGKVAEWVSRFGGVAYDFMVVLDADSSMAGDTLLRLADAMQRNPGIGLIQTAPTITGAYRHLFARMSQFGVRMYGRVAAAGLAWWAKPRPATGATTPSSGSALSPRPPACRSSPGAKPFGGHVLSHDVIEAALLRRAGWAVHVTAALDGSCEETLPTLLDFLQRDQRWCQGNLQHLGIIGHGGSTRSAARNWAWGPWPTSRRSCGSRPW